MLVLTIRRTILIGMLALGADLALGQEYPSRPIRIVTAAAGGGNDIAARIIAQGIAGPLGQPVIVENRPSLISTEAVARAQPDGYTLSVVGNLLWTGPITQNKIYDPLTEFSPITIVATRPFLLVAHASLPVKSVAELIALAKAKSGDLTIARSTFGSDEHLAAELLKAMAGIDLVHVPYKGNAQAKVDLLGGRVSVFFEAAVTAMPDIKAGKLRALAVSGETRSQFTPELPTIAEAGVPGYEAVVWIGLFAPSGVSREVVDKLHQASIQVLRMSDVKDLLLAQGFEPVGSSPEQFAGLLKSELEKWGKLIKRIKDSGVRLD